MKKYKKDDIKYGILDSLMRDDSGNALLIEGTGLRWCVQQVRLPAQISLFFRI